MNTTASAVPDRTPSLDIRTILWIGLVAGTLDILDAIIFSHFRGVTPKTILQYIASGLIGMGSFHAGAASAALGLFLHYCIALGWTVIFYAGSRKFGILVRRPIISGLLYGAIVYLVMNLVVLPLSGVPRLSRPISLASQINGVLAVMICVGLTISLLIRRAGQESKGEA